MNREMTMAEQTILDYAQNQMNRAEARGAVFPDEVKTQILEYASMLGDQSAVRRLVRNLGNAVMNQDEEELEDLLYDAKKEVRNFPDETIGMAELQGYGYTADDMYPLRREEALHLHQVGEKIYCLQEDGSRGEYASREMILAHEGIYGIEKTAWERVMNQEEEIDDMFTYLLPPMAVIDKEEALKLFDAGETIYLITMYQNPIAASERKEIERGAEDFQVEKDVLERDRYLEAQMRHHPQIGSLKEAKFLLESENRFAIYQIDDNSKGREYQFMGMNFLERQGMKAERSDYQMVYSGRWYPSDTLEGLFERFNMDRPYDFTGHSMSVSDVVVVHEEGALKAYFVDSFSFRELPDFIDLEQLRQTERVYQLEENEKGYRYLEIHEREEGFDYTFYDDSYKDMDGGVYDNSDISMDEAICDIVTDEKVVPGEFLEGYEEFQERVEESEKMLLTSGITEPDSRLNGQSMNSIEQMVLAIVEDEISEENLDAKVLGIRVYGSRTSDGIFREDSDVDVVVSYEGEIREDDFFQMLNESAHSVSGLKLDINPIRPDKSGTLEEFMERNKKYLDEKVEEYKPLAKVEELEEANYNMIDNVLNNMPPKKEPYLEYYAAGCDEYHDMSVYYRSENLQEMVEKYREFLDDPEKLYLGCGLGIIYREPNDSLFDEAEVGIVERKIVRGNQIDNIAFMAALPMVHEAVEQIRSAFPEMRYYPPKDIRDSLYPEQMTTEQLAAALNELVSDFDFYDYQDNFNPEEDIVETMVMELRCGKAHTFVPYLKDIVDEECGESLRAEVLLEKLKAYTPDIPEKMEPVVEVKFCEKSELTSPKYQKLGELDKMVSELDAELSSRINEKTGMPEQMYQMYFTIYYADEDKIKNIQGKINIGDGTGGMIGHLKVQNEIRLTDDTSLAYQQSKGEESFQAYMSDLTDMQEYVLPYLQTFCSLTEKVPEREESTPAVTENKGKPAPDVSTKSAVKPKVKGMEEKQEKKPIHERLKINKELIAKQRGKDSKAKGVEIS